MAFDPAFQRKLDLLYLLTRKEIALKYKRTTLGVFWSILNPLLTAVVFFIAFRVIMRFKMENYSFFLLSALFPWYWFSSSVLISGRALVDNVMLIKKVIFPRHYLVAACVLTQLVHLLFALPILFGFSLLTGPGPSAAWLVGVPALVGIQFLFTFGLTLIVAICNTYFRDVEYLAGVFINLLFWLTPITYPLEAVPEPFKRFFMLNPLCSLMFAWRELMMHNLILWDMLLAGFLVAIVSLFAGVFTFRAMEKNLDQVL